jgi:hypothetical protein
LTICIGLSWNQYTFSQDPVEVNNIIVEREGKTLIFLLYGTQESRDIGNKKKKTQSVIYYLDFAETLRDCQGADSATDDFEQWEPRGSFQSKCILGHETKYTRRKREAACLTGKAHMRKSFVSRRKENGREDRFVSGKYFLAHILFILHSFGTLFL